MTKYFVLVPNSSLLKSYTNLVNVEDDVLDYTLYSSNGIKNIKYVVNYVSNIGNIELKYNIIVMKEVMI